MQINDETISVQCLICDEYFTTSEGNEFSLCPQCENRGDELLTLSGEYLEKMMALDAIKSEPAYQAALKDFRNREAILDAI